MNKIATYNDTEYYWVATILKNQFSLEEVGIRDINHYGDNDEHPDRKYLERSSYFCEGRGVKEKYTYAPRNVQEYLLTNLYELEAYKERHLKVLFDFFADKRSEFESSGVPLYKIQIPSTMLVSMDNVKIGDYWNGIKIENGGRAIDHKSKKVDTVCYHKRSYSIIFFSEPKYGKFSEEIFQIMNVSCYLDHILPPTTLELLNYPDNNIPAFDDNRI